MGLEKRVWGREPRGGLSGPDCIKKTGRRVHNQGLGFIQLKVRERDSREGIGEGNPEVELKHMSSSSNPSQHMFSSSNSSLLFLKPFSRGGGREPRGGVEAHRRLARVRLLLQDVVEVAPVLCAVLAQHLG